MSPLRQEILKDLSELAMMALEEIPEPDRHEVRGNDRNPEQRAIADLAGKANRQKL
jgi:hypothetical protein